ncbi:protein CC2D2B isoform X3 [Rhineura floridana]|uniref:protein CC2D2B isoform X3 n=1 Tax=Rhineura floridana TaxID=261503 RepID=UPI002AC832D3|nr:protein CC2D2B isoform X3 [Rhineura floridana]
MDSDKEFVFLSSNISKKGDVQEKVTRKNKSLQKRITRKKQTEDDIRVDQVQKEAALDQNLQEALAEVEKQRLTEALRDRVREKLRTVKGEGSTSLKGSYFHHQMEDIRKKKSCAEYGKSATQEEKSYGKLYSDTKEYQKNFEVSTENEVSIDESFTFFTSTFEDHSKVKETDQVVGQKSIHDSLQNACALNEQAPLLDHVKEILLPELLEVKPPEYECSNLDKKKQWDQQLFVPSTSPVIHSCKLPNNMLPRFLEDEGFYIPRKPYISRNTYYKMENRLLQQDGGKNWFEESGEIMSLPSPIKQSRHCRMSFPVTIDLQLKTTYRKAMQPELENCIITKSEDQNEIYQLDLNISSIVFSHHSLFNCEQVLATRLLDLYECFQKRQQQNVTYLLSEKLKALVSATKLVESNLKTSHLTTKSLKDYRSQIRNTKILHDIECQRDNSLIRSMLKVWKQIKCVRRQQGFISTTVKLQFQRLAYNSELDEYKAKISEENENALREECDTDLSNKFSATGRKQKGCLDSTHAFQTSTDIREINEFLFVPHLTFVTEITAANMCPLDEQKRRKKVKVEKYFIKIYYNNKLVSSTPEAALYQDFKVIFQQFFRIQVLNWPESLQLEIFESNKKPTLLTKVYLPLPNDFILKNKDVLDEAEFSCEQQVKPSDGAVGSNVTFFLDENEREKLCILTSGKLIYSLSWTADDKGVPLAPTFQPAHVACNSVPRHIDSEKGTGIRWHSGTQKLIDWAKEANIDPNNPDYSDLIEFIMYAKSQEQNELKYFRLEQLQEEFNFVTSEEITNSKRFQLLHLRSLGQLNFYSFQQIPLYDREIPDTVFQEYGSQLENDMLMTDVDPISAQRNSSATFVRMMRKQATKRIVTIRHKFNLSDIVNDYEEIISMSQLSNTIFKLGERRRHLKPQRKERRKVPAQAISDGDVKLLIRILRAYNIPTRKAPPNKVEVAHSPSYLPNRMSRGRCILSGNSTCSADPLCEVTVHPFVEVTFQNTVYQTSTADGSHPCWNEELQVDFVSPGHDYTFSGLSKIKDNININIFDEFVIEKHEDTCPKNCSGHSYVRKSWLGSVMFPFSTLLEQSKICGTFQVNMPPVLLGYTWSKTYVPPKEECHGQNLKEYTFLTIFATIEPQLSSAENNLESDKFVDHEDETLLQRAYIFKQTCKALFPKRRIITAVFNNQGRNILVTKYITSLNPPQLLLDIYPDEPNSASDLISRFVSLIPCISETVDENDDVDLWMTSEGKVAYVATQDNGEYFLWNPLSGQCYKQFDAFCPLQSADCLISWENVWFNIQQNSSPMCVSFDISKESFWKQFLPYNAQYLKIQTVQPEELCYVPTDESLVVELQNRIEKTLKNKIMEWRSQQPTRWHRQCTSVLRQILLKLEFRNEQTIKEKEENYLEAFQELYWVTGFPIQMPYLDLQSITEAVYQTGIHSSDVPNTEFALAVYIHPYPNNTLSVWIYLVSLVRHQ